MDRDESRRRTASALFARLRETFPMLTMEPTAPPDGGIGLSIPEQPGLAFPIELRLQDDEMEIHAGDLHLAHMPWWEPAMREEWFESVIGLLAGEYRIRETRSCGRTIMSELQRPSSEGWQPFLITCLVGVRPRRTRRRILQNRP
jgi:hypothetical protein